MWDIGFLPSCAPSKGGSLQARCQLLSYGYACSFTLSPLSCRLDWPLVKEGCLWRSAADCQLACLRTEVVKELTRRQATPN